MREIKFRFWDKEENKYHFFDGIFNKQPWTETSTFAQYESFPKLHEGTVEQYTGLKDKNGKEIYEGDVVSVYWMAELGITELEFDENAVVEFDDCNFIAKLIKPIKTGVCEDGVYEETELQLTKWSHDEEVHLSFEIIGNIHENPELCVQLEQNQNSTNAEQEKEIE